jgi:glycosyltransferase involved in cell wall biosynthesis
VLVRRHPAAAAVVSRPGSDGSALGGALPSVLHILAPADFGGLESVVLTLARGQLDAGQRVTVAAFVDPTRSDHSFGAALTEAGIPGRTIPLATRAYLEERRRVRDLIRELRPAVVHTHGYRPDVVDSGVSRRMGVPTVTTVHGFTRGAGRARIYEWIQRRWFRRFDAVVVVSEPLRRELIASGVRVQHIHLVRNAWRAPRPPLARAGAREALDLGPRARIAGWVGRLTAEKGPDVMVEALAACNARDLALSIVGGGPMEAELRALAEKRHVAHRVRWHGIVPDAGRYLTAFDALLMTSWTEGTPIVLLEAMAAGVPIIATAVGGVPDVVSGREAVLVPAGDVAALGRALAEVLEDQDAAAVRCEEARKRLEREFSVEPWVQRYRDVYSSCL